MKVLVAYDGTLQSKEALRYGIEKVRKEGGEVLALHILDTGIFVDYDVSGAADAARRESAARVEEAKLLLKEAAGGIKATLYSGEGDPEEETLRFAEERNVDVLLCPPRYKSLMKRFGRTVEGGKGGTRIAMACTPAGERAM
jgi:nucleotide-binding universal stress UspA family protein